MNQVWNAANEITANYSYIPVPEVGWLRTNCSAFDLQNALIVVGNVSSSKLAKTKMAKSVLDAGWHILKTQLDYKSTAMQAVFVEVNEKYTTQTCSCCGCISSNSPKGDALSLSKGRAGLGIREWTCPECGATHDRDINAARNILALGHERLAGGISVL